MRVQFGPHFLELTVGDITTQVVDAIVNAANAELAGGGGVDGAIHRRGGPVIMDELRRLYPQGCPTGDAVPTSAGSLPAKYVFHAVGPIWEGGHRGEPELLKSAYRRCLELAITYQCRTMAFPALSAGAYGYPRDLAAEHALTTVHEFFVEHRSRNPLEVRFALFDAASYAAFARVLETLLE